VSVPTTYTTFHFFSSLEISLGESLEDFRMHDMRDEKHGRKTEAKSQFLLAAAVKIALKTSMR
jgi:hypothetical protein